jgi:hypothetical protein
MKQSLDASHRVLLDNFQTFLRAQLCLEEIKRYLSETLKEVEGEQPPAKTPPFRFKYNKGGWLQADAFLGGLAREKNTHHLVSIGIDMLDVPYLLTTAECRAYVYSGVLADGNKQSWHKPVGKFLSNLRPPRDFVPAPSDLDGYVFVKQLGNLSVEAFCSSGELKNYFREPLNSLSEWLVANASAIADFGASAVPDATNPQTTS